VNMTQRSIFITGAASGIGLATAKLFLERGWFVGAFDINQNGLHKLRSEAGPDRLLTRQLDVSRSADFTICVTEFLAAAGNRLDILFNNAGIATGGPFQDMTAENAKAVINTNLLGVIYGIQAAFSALKSTPNSLCFTTSSSSGIFGMPYIALYSATKHAVKGLTEALAIEFRQHGIRCSDVLPGHIITPLQPPGAELKAPTSGMFRPVPPEAVAEVVWRAYQEDRLHWYVPEEIEELESIALKNPIGLRDNWLAKREPS